MLFKQWALRDSANPAIEVLVVAFMVLIGRESEISVNTIHGKGKGEGRDRMSEGLSVPSTVS